MFRKHKRWKSTHSVGTEIVDVLCLKKHGDHHGAYFDSFLHGPDTAAPLMGVQSLCAPPSVIRIIWKKTSLSEQGPVSEGQSHRKLISWVCHRSMRLCEVQCSVTGAGALPAWHAEGQRGEEAWCSFTAEDRAVAGGKRRKSGMPHIPQCWKQYKVGEREKNQISTKRCQQ